MSAKVFAGLALTSTIVATALLAAPAKIQLAIGGTQRSALVYDFSATKDRAAKYPALIFLHGGGGTPEGMIEMSEIVPLAEKNKFFVFAPYGSGRQQDKFLTWNAGACCGYAAKNKIDDTKFIAQLINEMLAHYPIDAKRIFVAGHSNGAVMAYRLACDLGDKIAGVFANSAPAPASEMKSYCASKKIAPILSVHGQKDQCVSFEGGATCGGCFEKFFGLPQPHDQKCFDMKKLHASLVAGEQCQKQAVFRDDGKVRCEKFSECQNNFSLTECAIKEGGHTWPGGNQGVGFCKNRPGGFLCRRWKSFVGETTKDLILSDEIAQIIAGSK